MWQRVFALVIKEFLAILKDRRERIIIIVPPLFQLFLFSYAATFNLNHVPLAIYNQDNGAAAQRLISDFIGSKHFERVAVRRNSHGLAKLIDDQKALIILSIGPDFSSNLRRGENARVQIILDGRNSNTAMIALGYARQIIERFNRRWAEKHGEPPPVELVTRAWFNPNLESHWFIVPGIIGLLLLVVVTMVTALSVAREREQGTFDQLLVTPLRPLEILIGKSMPGLIIGLLESSALILLTTWWFDVPLRGSLLSLYTGIFLFSLSAIGIGLMISSMAATLQQALLGAFMFLVPSVILSGFATPISNMPTVVQYLTYLNPLRYFMVVVRGVFLEAAPFPALIGQFWPMALISLTTLTAAGWLFRHRLN